MDNGNHERRSESNDCDDYEDGVGPGSDDDDNVFRVRQKVVTVDPEEQGTLARTQGFTSGEHRAKEARITWYTSTEHENTNECFPRIRKRSENGEEVLDEDNGEPREVQVQGKQTTNETNANPE